ncbi:GNAT family N-acetyltransferase [Mycoplasma sp. 4423]
MKTFKIWNNDKKQEVLEYLYKKDPIQYLFLISDIEQYGLQNQNIKTFVLYNKKIEAIFLMFYSNLVVLFDTDAININEFLKILNNEDIQNLIIDTNFYNFLNKHKLIDSLDYIVEKEQIAKLDVNIFNMQTKDFLAKSKPVTETDIIEVINSKKQIKEWGDVSGHTLNVEYLTNELKSGYYQAYIIKDEQKVISHASISAKNKQVAMIGGVYTLNQYRRQGLAYDCVVNLIRKLLSQNLTPVLFFSNPAAAKMYYKLGFKDYGQLFVLHK